MVFSGDTVIPARSGLSMAIAELHAGRRGVVLLADEASSAVRVTVTVSLALFAGSPSSRQVPG